eukprot:15361879-Ditylum_brightwellii.AAC.1
MELMTIPHAMELSVIIGIGGRGCPISLREILNPTAALLLINSYPTSASAADAMAVLILVHSTYIAP